MTLETPEDWATYMDPALFGEVVTYEGQGRAPVTISAIFTAADATGGEAFGVGVATVLPVLTLGIPSLGFDPAEDDAVTVRGTRYRVADPKPDGTGLVRLTLEKE